MAYSFHRPITIDHTKCGSADSTNFPFLFSGTYDYLAHTTHGGDVTDLNGYDIIFTSDAAGTTQLDHEIESYNHETGAVIFWVRVPTVGYATDTVIYLWYANAAITTSQENVTGVWDSHFKGVYHHKTNDGDDSTGQNDLDNIVGTPDAVTGKFDGGLYAVWDESLFRYNPTFPTGTAARTFSRWMKLNATSSEERHFGGWGDNANNGSRFNWFMDATRAAIETRNGGAWINWTQDTNWHFWCATLAAGGGLTDVKIYLDGQFVSLTGTSGSLNTTNTLYYSSAAPSWLHGGDFTLDEDRISDVDRGADWILKEYNNQYDPATFYAVGEPIEIHAPSWEPPGHQKPPKPEPSGNKPPRENQRDIREYRWRYLRSDAQGRYISESSILDVIEGPQQPAFTGSGGVVGVGSLAGSGRETIPGSGTISGTAVLAATGVETFSGIGAITATAALAGTGTITGGAAPVVPVVGGGAGRRRKPRQWFRLHEPLWGANREETPKPALITIPEPPRQPVFSAVGGSVGTAAIYGAGLLVIAASGATRGAGSLAGRGRISYFAGGGIMGSGSPLGRGAIDTTIPDEDEEIALLLTS